MKKTLILVLAVFALSACDKRQAQNKKKTPSQKEASKEEVSKPKGAREEALKPKKVKEEKPTLWKRVKMDALNDGQKAQVLKAKTAQKALGKKLLMAVKGAMKSGGPVAAVDICSEKALPFTEEISKMQGVKIGRTSHKLRNPKNVAPVWMQSLNDGKHNAPAVFAGPNGELGLASPIQMKPPCLTCHGEKAHMPKELVTAIAKKYPEDKATGFKKGDLRGWFWVEVGPH